MFFLDQLTIFASCAHKLTATECIQPHQSLASLFLRLRSVLPPESGRLGLCSLESDMRCKDCGHALTRFSSEVAVHLHYPEGYQKRHMFAFPHLSVCLNCGFVQFRLIERQVEQLRRSASTTPIESSAA